MAAAYPRGKHGVLSVRVPVAGGASRIRSTGTTDPDVAADIEAALAMMRRRRMWRELEAVAAGRAGFSLDEVRDAWARDALGTLAAALDDVDLEPLIADWQQALRVKYPRKPRPASGGMDTPDHYLRHVRTLVAEEVPFPRSRFTAETLTAWLATRRVRPATQARYHAAMSSFAGYLVRTKVLAANPMRDVPFPTVKNARTRHLERAEIDRLLGALPEPYRTMEALTHGTGMEVAALAALRRRDVELTAATGPTVRAWGTKTDARQRVCALDAWAVPYLAAHLATLHPAAFVFPTLAHRRGYDAWARAHAAACRAVGIEDYRIHDARHSYAVRYMAAGAPAEYVSRQLGHANTDQVTQRYGRFRPSAFDVARFQAMADARDAEHGSDPAHRPAQRTQEGK